MSGLRIAGAQNVTRKGRAIRAVSVMAIGLVVGCSAPLSEAGIRSPGFQETWTPNTVQLKYREDPVDVGHPSFERLRSGSSSLVEDAWYDELNQYLVIALQPDGYSEPAYYQYCNLLPTVWASFNVAESRGSFYNLEIKGNFDCRGVPLPTYP